MGVNSSYVGRHLNLALLAPDIVEAIITGQEPDGLSLEKLYRLPVGWGEQRHALGEHGVPAYNAARREAFFDAGAVAPFGWPHGG